jgi:hypothetical protein
VPRWLPKIVLLAAGSAGCVIGRPARQSQFEAAQGPSAPPVTGSPVVPQISAPDGDDPPPANGKPGAVWVRGYWHWDGVRYGWERGRWQSAATPGSLK